MRRVTITNLANPASLPLEVRYCDTFLSQLKGYMFQKSLSTDEGLLLVQGKENRVDSTIHMFFMNFDLAVIWIGRDKKVVDLCLAHRWRPYYAPRKPAQFILETHPARLDQFHIGDQLAF